MIINNNISAINSARVLNNRSSVIDNNIEALSSGQRVNKAGDNPTDLAVSEKFRVQISGLKAASRNANNGISFVQTTEGYLVESQNLLKRVKELAVQAANGIYQQEDRELIQLELNQLVSEVDRISEVANFNGQPLLDGRFAQANNETVPLASLYMHVGANIDQRIQLFIATFNAASLGLDQISVNSIEESERSIGVLEEALNRVNAQRANLGAYQNRLESVMRTVDLATTNSEAAESKIRDLDIAEAVVELSKNTIVNQANIAALAQANTRAQSVLSLLQ